MNPAAKAALLICAVGLALTAADDRLVLRGANGPGRHRKIVLISGDEEYRSEQAMPQIARILAARHGFDCTVLFAVDPKDGTINPNRTDNIPGLEVLDTAELMILFTRFRDLPDGQMKHIVDYVESGRPIVAIRTATHAFDLKSSPTYRRWSWNDKESDGGFGRRVLGETWISHHGRHGVQSTRGIIAKGQEEHPVLRGIRDGDIWVPTDVYKVRLPLPGDAQPIVLGQVVDGMKPSDPAAPGKPNDPMMPVAWTRTYTGERGKTSRILTTTMGSAQDILNEPLRRLLVNAAYWALRMDKEITPRANVDIVRHYDPLPFGFGGFAKGLKPADQ